MAPAVGKAVSQREGWSGSASAPFQRSDGLQRYHRSRRGLQFNLIPSGVVRTRPRGVAEDLTRRGNRGSAFALTMPSPEVHAPAGDLHHHLVQMPPARRRRSAASQVRRDQRTDLVPPAAHRLAADLNSTQGKQFFDIAKAQRELEIQPHRLADHIRREPVTLEQDRPHLRMTSKGPLGPNWRQFAL